MEECIDNTGRTSSVFGGGITNHSTHTISAVVSWCRYSWMSMRVQKVTVFTHAWCLWYIGTRRIWTICYDTVVSFVLLCCSWKWIGKIVLTGRDVKGVGHVV